MGPSCSMLMINPQHARSGPPSGSSCVGNPLPLQAHPVLDKTPPFAWRNVGIYCCHRSGKFGRLLRFAEQWNFCDSACNEEDRMLKNCCGLGAFVMFGTIGFVQAQTKSAPDQPTFARDVAPI